MTPPSLTVPPVETASVLRAIFSVLAEDSEEIRSQVSEDSSLTSLGLDSLGALAARDALIRLYGISPAAVPSTLLVELPTVKSVVEWFSAEPQKEPLSILTDHDPYFYVKADQLPHGAECCVPLPPCNEVCSFTLCATQTPDLLSRLSFGPCVRRPQHRRI